MSAKGAAKAALRALFARGAGSMAGAVPDGAELVTFDVFDTLVARECGEPGAVFDIVERAWNAEHPERLLAGFRARRERAESAARRAAAPNREVTLGEIYARMPGVPEGSREDLEQLEMACELAVCRPNGEMVALFDEIRRTRRVALVSDAYLPAWLVSMILDGCGIEGYEALYVSSEHGAMKRGGALFEAVLRDLGVGPDRAFHIGDHPLADWLSPRSIGIGSFLLGNEKRHVFDRQPTDREASVHVVIYSESWIVGGIESFVMNELRFLPAENFQVTLFSTWGDSESYSGELSAMGIGRHIEFDGSKPNLAIRSLEGLRAFDRLLTVHKYDAVHINTMNGMGLAYAWVAQRRHVPIRIVHAHGTMFSRGFDTAKHIVHGASKRLFSNSPTSRLACSRAAGEYLFGADTFNIVPNGIDIDRFRFDAESRQAVRTELNVSDECVLLGNIGRVTADKNSLYQVRIFAAFHDLVPHAKYLMIGTGDLDGDVLELAAALGVRDCLMRIESTPVPERYYPAMDAFLLPSTHEGLPMVAIEAQCSGLPVLASAELPHELAITDLVEWESLDSSPSDWAAHLVQLVPTTRNRAQYSSMVAKAGFSMVDAIHRIATAYVAAAERGDGGSRYNLTNGH